MLLSRKNGISHIEVPTLSQHKRFVLNHPYRVWCLVRLGSKIIGNFYILKSNEVAVHLNLGEINSLPLVIEKIHNNYKPLKLIKSVRAERFDFNISPNNHCYLELFKKMGARLTQLTYCFDYERK